MNKIRLGIIGCGHMSGTHAKGYRTLSNQMIVAATSDIVLERARTMADAAGAEIAVVDYHDLLDYVDAVLIVLPHDLHYSVGMDCLKRGKHVLMEKPLAMNEQQCLDLIHTAEKEELVLMTAYPMRFHPLVVGLKQLIDSREYGDVFQISIWTEQLTRYEAGHWGLSADRLGGGQFFSHGCHYIDLLFWMLGKPVRGSHLGTNYGTPWMEKEGTSHATIEFESGAIGYHAGTWGARGTRLGSSIHAHCTKGMIEANITERKLFVHNKLKDERSEKQVQNIDLIMELDEDSKFTQHEISHFIHCLQTGQKPLTDGFSSLQGLRAIWRMYEAEQKGIIADLRGLGIHEEQCSLKN